MSLIPRLHQWTCRTPDKLALVCGENSWTYSEFDRLTDLVASRLRAAGIQPGDRIAFHLLNVPELALGYVGCFKAQAIAVPVNTRLKAPEIEYILRHSGAACYIGQPELYSEVAGLRKQMPELRMLYLAGDFQAGDGLRPFGELLQPGATPVCPPAPDPDEAAAILYTSGTTARPKGVTHSHETLTQIARAMRHVNLDENQIVLVISSMAHIVGFGLALLGGLLNGATVVLLPGFEPLTILQAYERHRCTYTLGLPVLLHAVTQAQAATPHDVSSGRFWLCGGDSVSPTLQEAFVRVTGQTLIEGYGGTEAVPLTFNPAGGVRVGSIGRAVEGVAIRLVDAEGRDVRLGDVGEICIRGAVRMTGYWRDPEATAAAVRDGWFHTGDLARCDEDGYYWFAGRTKEIIIRGGSNISPQEVEAVLLEHPAVREAAVIGRPDPVWGETVVAYVVLETGSNLTAAAIIAFARERMATYKIPDHIVFLEALPKSATGKLNRRALREAERASRPATALPND